MPTLDHPIACTLTISRSVKPKRGRGTWGGFPHRPLRPRRGLQIFVPGTSAPNTTTLTIQVGCMARCGRTGHKAFQQGVLVNYALKRHSHGLFPTVGPRNVNALPRPLQFVSWYYGPGEPYFAVHCYGLECHTRCYGVECHFIPA